MSGRFDIRPIGKAQDFEARWAALHARSDAGFFLSPAWIDSWVALAREKADLYVIDVAGARGPDLMGVISISRPRLPVLGTCTLRLHEAGDAALDRIYMEYNDFLVAKEAAPDCRDIAWRHLLTGLSATSSFVVQNAVPACRDSLFRVAGRDGFACRTVQENPVYVTALDALHRKGQTVLASLSKNTRKQVERAMRLYEERGPLALQVAQGAENEAQHWKTLVSLHNQVWEARGGKGVFDNPALTEFHSGLRQSHPAATELLEIRAGDEVIGSLYNFIHRNSVMNYQSGFQYAEDNRLKPGLVSHVLAAQHYLDRGFEVYDFLAGDQRYKQSLGEVSQTFSLIEAERPGIRTGLRQLARTLKARIS